MKMQFTSLALLMRFAVCSGLNRDFLIGSDSMMVELCEPIWCALMIQVDMHVDHLEVLQRVISSLFILLSKDELSTTGRCWMPCPLAECPSTQREGRYRVH